jgi:hypothetical protein
MIYCKVEDRVVTLPQEKETLLIALVEALSAIDGVRGVVLGGSHANGMAMADSDIDIGLYYAEAMPFDIKAISAVAEQFSDSGTPTVTGFYAWGPWVNGGAWINTPAGEVDFVYKNIDQVATTIAQAHEGIWVNDFEQQPPYGFSSVTFLAETLQCVVLYDPEGILKRLKQQVAEYPAKLRATVVQQSLWAAEFTLWQGSGFAGKADLYNACGCITRAVKSIVTALFALNSIYPLGDKRALAVLERAPVKPEALTARINQALTMSVTSLPENLRQLQELHRETVGLAGSLYKPYFQL